MLTDSHVPPPALRALERGWGRPLREVLQTDYAGWQLKDIARELDVSEKTVQRWMRAVGLRMSDLHEADGNPPSAEVGQSPAGAAA